MVFVFEIRQRTEHAGKSLQNIHRPDNSSSARRTTHDRLQDNPAFSQKIRNLPQPQHDLFKPESHGKEKLDKTRSGRRWKNLLLIRTGTENGRQHERVYSGNSRRHKNHAGKLKNRSNENPSCEFTCKFVNFM